MLLGLLGKENDDPPAFPMVRFLSLSLGVLPLLLARSLLACSLLLPLLRAAAGLLAAASSAACCCWLAHCCFLCCWLARCCFLCCWLASCCCLARCSFLWFVSCGLSLTSANQGVANMSFIDAPTGSGTTTSRFDYYNQAAYVDSQVRHIGR